MYKCNKCDRIFVTKHARGGHQRLHSNKKRSGSELINLINQSKKQKQKCQSEYFKNPLYCTKCSKVIPYEKGIRKKSEKKSKNYNNVFCNSSCAAKFNNVNKKYGTRRSKLEKWLEKN